MSTPTPTPARIVDKRRATAALDAAMSTAPQATFVPPPPATPRPPAPAATGEPDDDTLAVEPILSLPGDEATVLLAWGQRHGALTPQDARALALKLLEAAERAETSSALVQHHRATRGIDDQQAADLLGSLVKFMR